MEFFAKSGAPPRQRTSCAIVGIYDNGKLSSPAAQMDEAGKHLISKVVSQGDMRGKSGHSLLLTQAPGLGCQRILLVGCGAKKSFDLRKYFQATQSAAKTLAHTSIKDAISYLPLQLADTADPYYLARLGVDAVASTCYRFSETKSGKQRKPSLMKFGLAMPGRAEQKRAEQGCVDGVAIAAGQALTRDLGNLPANICNPSYLVKTAKHLAANDKRLELKVETETQMKRLGMGALLSVTSGSEQPAKLIVLRYRGASARTKPYVLVGKGITFDTGGISLKPAPAMDEMKFDMCGAASVLGTLLAVTTLKLPINVVGVVPACENMPGGLATRPGDVVTSMSGKTVEILNTDAEGRLILCDALTYARRFHPHVIIDVATLTGACVIALGSHLTGLMSNDPELTEDLLDAGRHAADQAWQLPLADEYAEQLKSNFADMANVGGREGGAITAASFLSRFTEGLRWAHLDVAGTAWKSGANKGATGRPVPLLTEFLIRRSRNASGAH